MTTIFTRIIEGQIPGTFVYRDSLCVAFLSINPLAAGHVLVVPIQEVELLLSYTKEGNFRIVQHQVG